MSCCFNKSQPQAFTSILRIRMYTRSGIDASVVAATVIRARDMALTDYTKSQLDKTTRLPRDAKLLSTEVEPSLRLTEHLKGVVDFNEP